MGKSGEMGVKGVDPCETLPFKLRENFLGLVDFVKGAKDDTGGLASPLLWVETVAMDEGMLDILLCVLVSGEMRMRGVE